MNAEQVMQAAPSCRNDGCYGVIVPNAKDGRFYLHRDVYINLPKDYVALRCTGCGEYYFTQESKAAFFSMLENEYSKHAEMVADVISKFRQRQLKKKDKK